MPPLPLKETYCWNRTISDSLLCFYRFQLFVIPLDLQEPGLYDNGHPPSPVLQDHFWWSITPHAPMYAVSTVLGPLVSLLTLKVVKARLRCCRATAGQLKSTCDSLWGTWTTASLACLSISASTPSTPGALIELSVSIIC